MRVGDGLRERHGVPPGSAVVGVGSERDRDGRQVRGPRPPPGRGDRRPPSAFASALTRGLSILRGREELADGSGVGSLQISLNAHPVHRNDDAFAIGGRWSARTANSYNRGRRP